MKPSDEFALVAACCIWPPSQRRNEAILAAAISQLNWDRVLRIARRQRVEALVKDGLENAGIATPDHAREILAKRARRIMRKNRKLAAESLRLQKEFDEAGIANLILKGTTLSVLAYVHPFVKAARDVDLLVSPQDVERGIALLEAAGYVRADPKGLSDAQFRTYLAMARECNFVRDRIFVEIKWRLSDNPELLKGVSLSSTTQLVPMGDGDFLRTLGKDDLFAYLCVHGATHAWARLKWIADLGALLERESLEERERLYRAAETRGAGPSAAQGLLLCRRLLGTELPPVLAKEFESDVRTRWLAAAAMYSLLAGEKERSINSLALLRISAALSHFLLGRGWPFFAAEMRSKWVNLHDHVHVPLPRWAYFLYPVIRLPLFVWRRVFGA